MAVAMRGHHIGRARSRRSDGHNDAARCARVTVRHVRRALFVAHQYVMNVAELQRVIGGQNRAAGIAKDRRNSLLLQTFPQNLRARFHHKIDRLNGLGRPP